MLVEQLLFQAIHLSSLFDYFEGSNGLFGTERITSNVRYLEALCSTGIVGSKSLDCKQYRKSFTCVLDALSEVWPWVRFIRLAFSPH